MAWLGACRWFMIYSICLWTCIYTVKAVSQAQFDALVSSGVCAGIWCPTVWTCRPLRLQPASRFDTTACDTRTSTAANGLLSTQCVVTCDFKELRGSPETFACIPVCENGKWVPQYVGREPRCTNYTGPATVPVSGSCLTSSDCNSGLFCVNYICQSSTTQSSTTASASTPAPAPTLAPTTTLVGEGGSCSTDAECVSGLSCRNNKCSQPTNQVSEGGACTTDAECVSGLSCRNNKCSQPINQVGEGGACNTDAECVSGLSCRNNKCSQRMCEWSAPDGTSIRYSAVGLAGEGGACMQTEGCVSGLFCRKGLCARPTNLPDTLVLQGSGIYDTSTNINWGFQASSTLPLVGDKIRNCYATSRRLSTSLELLSLFKKLGNGTAVDTFLEIVTNSTHPPGMAYGLAYDPPSKTLRVVAVTPGSTNLVVGDPLDPRVSLPGVGVWSVQWFCNSSTSSGVNVLDTYPNVSLADTTADGCLCSSGYTGPSCSTLTREAANASDPCPFSTPTANELRDGRQTVQAWVNDTDNTAVVKFTTPVVQTRRYIQFAWGNCQSLTNSGTLRQFSTVSVFNTCYDTYQASFLISGLAPECGLERQIDPAGFEGFTRYRGDFTLLYQELVQVVPGLTLTRTSTLIAPLDLLINSTVSGEMGNSSLVVFSPFQLQAAVTGTLVKRDATTSLVAFTLAINAPYAVMNIMAQPTSAPKAGVSPLAQVCMLRNITDVSPLCAGFIDWTTDSGLSNCDASDYGPSLNQMCRKTILLQLTHGGACSLDHTITLSGIGVYCASQYGSGDCPMGPSIGSMDNSSSLQFNVAADQFCSGQRALRINDAISIQNYTMSKVYNRRVNNSTQRTFLMNDMVYFMLSIDTRKSLRVLDLQVLAFQTKFSSMGLYVQPDQAAGRILETYDEEDNKLGWDTATQTYVLRMQLNSYFVQDSTGNPLLVVSPGGKSPPIYVQMIFMVSYNGGPGIVGRRRRRTVTPFDMNLLRSSSPAIDPSDDPRAETLENESQRAESTYGQAAVGTSLSIDNELSMESSEGQADFASFSKSSPPARPDYACLMLVPLSCVLMSALPA